MIQVNVKEQLGKLDKLVTALGAGHFEAYVVSSAEYSAYQEFGTEHMEANAYMGPSVAANEDSLPTAIKMYGIANIGKAVRATAALVANDAQMIAPYDTGYLKGHIKVSSQDQSGEAVSARKAVASAKRKATRAAKKAAKGQG